jgi:PhzF family phenazine biosynthesis protein
MKIPLYHVDAFSSQVFGGNPAAVCPLPQWIDETLLQAIASENNLSETAFLVRLPDGYEIRWFTPTVEVDLCGHATLASGFVVLNMLEPASHTVQFHSKSGPLRVSRSDTLFSLDFPSLPPKPCAVPDLLTKALGKPPDKILGSRDYLAIYLTEEDIRCLKPDMSLLQQIDRLGVIVTAPGSDADFVSRFFAPGSGIPEDPVTGSAHCTLIPYWSNRLGKTHLHAYQVSARGGELFCEDQGERVRISGQAVLYSEGTLYL